MFGRRQGEAITLPQGKLEPTIAAMIPGETGWTVPWAVMVDEDMRCWINGRYPILAAPHGTVEMQLNRTPTGVEILRWGSYQYQPSRGIHWVGATEDDLLPVEGAPPR